MGNFPASGGGPSSGPGLNPFLQYCSPSGNDANDGLTWSSAKKTFNGAMAAIQTHGGGEIHFASGTTGNIWMRDDGLAVPGFWPSVSLRVVGHGAGHVQFGEPAATLAGGTTADRLHPMIWITASGTKPIALENIIPSGTNVNQVLRTWDYQRTALGAIAWKNIISWDRTHANTTGEDGRSTVEVALDAAININSIQRAANITRINFTLPSPMPPIKFGGVGKGQWVKVASTNVSFPSGDFEVIETDGVSYFKYDDPGSNAGPVSSAGTWQTNCVAPNDRIEVTSTQTNNFPTTQYKVLSCVDATHFIVNDYYGSRHNVAGGNFPNTGTWSNPGTYVLQNRNSAIGLMTLDNVQGGTSGETEDRYVNGPTVDLGGTTDGRLIFKNTAFQGMVSNTIGCHDPDRACWMLIDPGNNAAGSAYIRQARPAGGGIRIFGSSSATWGIDAKDIYGDIEVSTGSPPQLEVLNGNSFGYIYADSVITFDAPADVPNIIIPIECALADVRIINCGLTDGPGLQTGGRIQAAWGVQIDSPMSKGQYGPWVGDRISGRTADGFRNLGLLSSSRYANKVVASGSWTLNGATRTSGQTDPFGGTGAIKLEKSSAVNVIIYSASQTVTDGDIWVYSCWVRRVGGTQPGPNGYVIATSHGVLTNALNFLGDGEWQFLVCKAEITSSGGPITFEASIGIADALYVFQPTLIKIPAGDMTDNELAEFYQSFRGYDNYLLAGASGTAAGTKFIAHGGLGTDSANAKTVGVGSGQLTLTGSGTVYVPTYDADGTTIIGWVAQLQATINP